MLGNQLCVHETLTNNDSDAYITGIRLSVILYLESMR